MNHITLSGRNEDPIGYRAVYVARDRYKRQSNSWRDKALRLHALLCEVAAIDDGDDPGLWKYDTLFKRVHAEIKGEDVPHASDCAS